MLNLKPELEPESTLFRIPTADVEKYLELVGPLIERAIAKGRYQWTWGAVVDLLKMDQMHLWVSVRGQEIEACAVTQIIRYPRMKVCGVPFIGGRALKNWKHFDREIGRWAKAQGCEELEGYDVRGGAWLRALEGWSRGYIQIRKVL